MNESINYFAKGAIANKLTAHTCENAKFDKTRDYISLSHGHLTIEEIVQQAKHGFKDTEDMRMLCYKGYQMEADLKNRIKNTFPEEVDITQFEITAFDGKAQGHPDFRFLGFPGDCKSVLMDDHLPKDNKLPRKVFVQMQGYMHFMGKDRALVIYESREKGRLAEYWIRPVISIQKEIEFKISEALKILGR